MLEIKDDQNISEDNQFDLGMILRTFWNTFKLQFNKIEITKRSK